MGRGNVDLDLVYGVTIAIPNNMAWPVLLERLEEMKGPETLAKVAARAISQKEIATVEEEGTGLPEPIAKYAKAYKSVIVAWNDVEDEKKSETWEESDSFIIDYLCKTRKKLRGASADAISKVLGNDNHGLILKTYALAYRGQSWYNLALQLKEKSFKYHDQFWGDGVLSAKYLYDDLFLGGKEKETVDSNIQKVMEIFGMNLARNCKGPGQIAFLEVAN